MKDNEAKTLIEKLNGRNYVPWSYRMKLFLKSEKCCYVIEQDARRNAIIVHTKEKKMNEQAGFIISACVEVNQLPIIKRMASPKATWDALSNYHEKSPFSSKMRLLRQLYHEGLQKNGDMDAHLTKLSVMMIKSAVPKKKLLISKIW